MLRPFARQKYGQYNLFCTHDGNKNVSDVVSYQAARGAPAHYEYAPFGAVTAATTNTAFTAFNVAETNPFRFSSEYADDMLGLVYYNYRHYNPEDGRWTSRDVILEDGGNNIYEFCNNNSVRYFDSNGELVQLTIPVGVAIAAVAEKIMEAAIGAMIAYVASEIATEVVTQAQEKQCKPPKKCAPCSPPAGTLMYRMDEQVDGYKFRNHYPFEGSHIHYLRVNQDANCGCHANPAKDVGVKGVSGGKIPLPGAIPLVPVTGGGVLY